MNQLCAVTQNYYGGFDKLAPVSLQLEHASGLFNRFVNVDPVAWPQSGATGVISFTDSDIVFSRLSDNIDYVD